MLYPVSYDRVVPRVSKSWVRASGTTQDDEVSLGAILHASSGQLVSRVGSRDRDYSRHASRLEGLRSIPSSVDSSSRSADIEGERCGQLIERSHASQCRTTPTSLRGLCGTGEASSDRSVGARSAPDSIDSSSRSREGVERCEQFSELSHTHHSESLPASLRGLDSYGVVSSGTIECQGGSSPPLCMVDSSSRSPCMME